LADLSTFTHDGNTLTVPAGHHFFKAGDHGHEMYVIVAGEAEIRLRGKLLETVHAGGIFGEMALIDHHERSAEVVAKTPATVAVIDEDRFHDLVRSNPAFSLEVMRVMAERLRHIDDLL
jgi:CRP-like cAMP-binding protein